MIDKSIILCFPLKKNYSLSLAKAVALQGVFMTLFEYLSLNIKKKKLHEESVKMTYLYIKQEIFHGRLLEVAMHEKRNESNPFSISDNNLI